MTVFIGIDPGITGAVFCIEENGPFVTDTPCITMKKSGGKGNKTDYLPADMAAILRPYDPRTCHVFIEKVGAMPGQGVTSMFGFGKGFGLWLGILAALELPYTLVTPQAWKKEMMKGISDKEASIHRAQQLWPKYASLFQPQRGIFNKQQAIGRADAALIAEYGRRTLT